MADINNLFTTKQQELLSCSLHEQPKILIASGAKRAGKTFILDIGFLRHVRKYKNMGVSFIIGGATSSTIRRNVLDDLEKMLGINIKLNKEQGFELWGNMIYCFGGSNADSWKAVRGFTAAGAFLNEGTALHDSFVKEVISRCSYEGARVFIDTNPENPTHSIKTDYIDNDGQMLESGRLNIKVFNFTLYDNTFLPSDYIESIEKATPTGMFYDRDILGLWVAAEGVVYKDFDQKTMVLKDYRKEAISEYIAGVDWGYEHLGSITVIGIDQEGNHCIVEEHTAQYEEIDYWVNVAEGIKEKYGNIPFYADSARPEHVARFSREGFKVKNGNKSILSGIEEVGKLMKQKKFYVLETCKQFLKEVYNYVWDEIKGMPVKKNDDVMDSVRYAIYTHSLLKLGYNAANVEWGNYKNDSRTNQFRNKSY